MASKSSPLLILFIELLVTLVLAQAQDFLPPPIVVDIPGVPLPDIPNLPIPGAPGVPGVPIPDIPGVPGTPIPGIPQVPGVPVPGIPGVPGTPEIQECWASIINIGGCYAEIYRAFQSGRGDYTVGPTCCKAVKDVSSTCWPRMFPYNPFFPPLLQDYCARYTKPVPVPVPVPIVAVPPVAPAPEEDAPAPEMGA